MGSGHLRAQLIGLETYTVRALRLSSSRGNSTFLYRFEETKQGGRGYKIYKIWSMPNRNLKVPLACSKTIPPLLRRELEGQLTPELLRLLGSYVGGQCKYERMFGDLDQDAWAWYTNEEQEKDVELLGAAIGNGRFDNGHFYYHASW